jgi:hypothetical protein
MRLPPVFLGFARILTALVGLEYLVGLAVHRLKQVGNALHRRVRVIDTRLDFVAAILGDQLVGALSRSESLFPGRTDLPRTS